MEREGKSPFGFRWYSCLFLNSYSSDAKTQRPEFYRPIDDRQHHKRWSHFPTRTSVVVDRIGNENQGAAYQRQMSGGENPNADLRQKSMNVYSTAAGGDRQQSQRNEGVGRPIGSLTQRKSIAAIPPMIIDQNLMAAVIPPNQQQDLYERTASISNLGINENGTPRRRGLSLPPTTVKIQK